MGNKTYDIKFQTLNRFNNVSIHADTKKEAIKLFKLRYSRKILEIKLRN